MKIILIIIGIHAMLVGFALLLAGIMSLAVPSATQVNASRQQFEAERQKGFWRYTAFCINQIKTARTRGILFAISNWPEQPKSRRMIYIGVSCLVVATAIGYHLGIFDS